MSNGVRIWKGKAGRRAPHMAWSTYDLLRLLDRLKLLPPNFDDDWQEVVRCYVDRILSK